MTDHGSKYFLFRSTDSLQTQVRLSVALVHSQTRVSILLLFVRFVGTQSVRDCNSYRKNSIDSEA